MILPCKWLICRSTNPRLQPVHNKEVIKTYYTGPIRELLRLLLLYMHIPLTYLVQFSALDKEGPVWYSNKHTLHIQQYTQINILWRIVFSYVNIFIHSMCLANCGASETVYPCNVVEKIHEYFGSKMRQYL
jgi:hypothetical protein